MKWEVLKGEPLVIGFANGNPAEAVESVFSGTDEAFTTLDFKKGNTGEDIIMR